MMQYTNYDIIEIFEEHVKGTDKYLKLVYSQMDYLLIRGEDHISEHGDLLCFKSKDPILSDKEVVHYLIASNIRNICVIDNIDDIINASKTNWMNILGVK